MADGHYSAETARSLRTFLRALGGVDVRSIRFHFERSDFQKGISAILGDELLARRIDKVDTTLPPGALGLQLADDAQKDLGT